MTPFRLPSRAPAVATKCVCSGSNRDTRIVRANWLISAELARRGLKAVSALEGIETTQSTGAGPDEFRLKAVSALEGIETYARSCYSRAQGCLKAVSALEGIETSVGAVTIGGSMKSQSSICPGRD